MTTYHIGAKTYGETDLVATVTIKPRADSKDNILCSIMQLYNKQHSNVIKNAKQVNAKVHKKFVYPFLLRKIDVMYLTH